MAVVNIFLKICSILLIPYIAASPLQSRIINGTVAVVDNTQHQVSVRMKDLETSFGLGHICGGSLITPNVVLTAAHCFYDEDIEMFSNYANYFVVMGTMNLLENTKNTVSIDVKEIIHHDFVRLTFENDLALLMLKENMPTSNPTIKVIPLNREFIPAGTVCQVSGWGATDEDGGMSNSLMTVDLPIIDHETCSTNYEEGYIMDGMICAGFMEGGKDACQGDSGGPVVSEGKLVGITSYGDGCAQPNSPGVYTNVSFYADWIESTIANRTSVLKPDGNNKPVVSVNVVSLSFNFLIKFN